MKKVRMPGLPKEWQEFFMGVIFHMIWPLLPLLFEFIKTGEVTESSLTLTTALYAVTIAISSRNKLLFAIGLIISFCFGFSFGLGQGAINVTYIASGSIIGIFVIHATERYNRHVVEEAPFFDFD